MAESISEGTLKTWNKKVGDYVEADEEIASIETDKVRPLLIEELCSSIVATILTNASVRNFRYFRSMCLSMHRKQELLWRYWQRKMRLLVSVKTSTSLRQAVANHLGMAVVSQV